MVAASGVRSAAAALSRKRKSGSDGAVGVAHALMLGSSSASRQRSTRGKREAIGRAAVSVEVDWLHAVSSAGEADGSLDVGVATKRALR